LSHNLLFEQYGHQLPFDMRSKRLLISCPQILQSNQYFFPDDLKTCLGCSLFLLDQNLTLTCEAKELLKQKSHSLLHNFWFAQNEHHAPLFVIALSAITNSCLHLGQLNKYFLFDDLKTCCGITSFFLDQYLALSDDAKLLSKHF
jgi:hypothetical protein